jgi:hypothetical protein
MKLRHRAPWAMTVILFWVALIACGDLGNAGGSPAGPSADPGAASGSPSASPARTETPDDDRVDNEDNHAAEPSKQNVVEILNKTPGKLRMRASVQFNRIKGDTITPLNAAVAVGQDCTGCQTIAIALQLNLYRQGAHVVAPENYSVALNVKCTGCITISHAIQYSLPVADPEDDNDDRDRQGDAKSLMKRMQKELDAIAKTKGITADQAEQRIEGVLAEFRALASSMQQDLKRTDQEDSPSPSPRPSRSPAGSPAPSPVITPSGSPSRTPAPTASP